MNRQGPSNNQTGAACSSDEAADKIAAGSGGPIQTAVRRFATLPAAHDDDAAAARLWTVSEQLVAR